MTGTQELPQFDVMDTTLRGARFHDAMKALRGHWLAQGPLGYVVVEREAAHFFLRSKACTFPGKKLAELFGMTDGALGEEVRRNILHIDGEDHRRLRNLVNPAFTPRAADTWRPRMREFLAQLWDGLDGAQEIEFVEAFAKPYPSLTIAAVLGAPLGDAPRLHHWSNTIQRQFDGPFLMEHRDEVEASVTELYAYLRDLLAARRDDPAEDLISTLLTARHESDRLSEDELVNLVLNVLIGGVDTTQAQLSHAMRLLAEHPDQWALLRLRPELAPNVVWEALRYEPITPFTARITTEEVAYRDVTFPPDTVIMVSTWAANRDAEAYDEPDAFDISKDRGAEKPFTFGAGIHYCLGANLARAELEEALAFLSARIETLALAGEPQFDTINGIYGLDRLPLRYAASDSA
jgi:cytochrome P450